MKKVLLAISLLVIFINNYSKAQWVKLSGNDGYVQCITTNGNNIYAGNYYPYGVYLSTDNGINWKMISNGLPSSNVNALASKGSNIYAGVYGYGLYISTDNGSNWTLKPMGSDVLFHGSDDVSSLAITDQYVIAGTAHGVVISPDNGSTWILNGDSTDSKSINSVLVNGNEVYAGGFECFEHTTLTWEQPSEYRFHFFSEVNSDLVFLLRESYDWVTSLAVSGNTMFAGTNKHGIIFSNDNWKTWNYCNNGLKMLSVNSIVVAGTTLLAGTSDGVYISINNGINWIKTSINIPMNCLSVLGTDIYAGGQGIWKRSLSDMTKAVSLTKLNGGERCPIGSSKSITWNSIGIDNVKLEYSIDNGLNWATIVSSTPASSGSYNWIIPNNPSSKCLIRISDAADNSINDMSIDNIIITSLAVIAPNGGENWYCGSSQSILWNSVDVANVKIEYSTNNGSTWNVIASSLPASTGNYQWFIPSFNFTASCKVRISDVANSSSYVVSDSFFTVQINIRYLTSPLQDKWEKVGFGNLATEPMINSLLSTNDRIYAGTNNDIYSSNDNGTSWITNSLNTTISSFVANGNDIYAATSNGVTKSTDNGANWIDVLTINKEISGLVIKDNTIYAGTYNGDIYSLSSGENTWTKLSSIAPSISLNDLQENTNTLYASTSYGIYTSTNNGSTWEIASNAKAQISAPIFTTKFYNTTFFIGTNYSGIWYSDVTGKYARITPIDYSVYSIIPVSQDEIYCSTNSGVKYFVRDGSGWIQYDLGLMNIQTPALIKTADCLFAGTISDGIYRLEFNASAVNSDKVLMTEYSLSQNYPNPFNPITTINYSVPTNSFVTIKVYDVLGKEIETLVNVEKASGNYQIVFDGSKLSSGTYFYRMQAGDFAQTKKLILLK